MEVEYDMIRGGSSMEFFEGNLLLFLLGLFAKSFGDFSEVGRYVRDMSLRDVGFTYAAGGR